MKNKIKDGAPVFTARNYPPASFSMSTDGRKAKGLRQDRRNLFLQVSSYGLKPWPSVAELAEMMGWGERWTYRILEDLKQLGCLPNAKDAKGRKYTGRNGTRVRSVDIPVLPLPGSSPWMPVKDCLTSDGIPLLVQFVNRPVEGLHDSIEGLHDSIEGLHSRSADERTSLERTNLERTNPNPKETDGWMDSFSVRLGKAPSAGERQQVGALVRADGLEKFAKVADLWLHRPEGIDTLKRRWAMFLNEYPLYRTQFEQDQPTPELSTEDVEANRLRMVAMYGDLDKNYYVEKLKEAKADYDVNGQLFDEKTRQEMRDQIAEYEATVKEMAA